MLGELTLAPKLPIAELLAERDGAFGAAVDSTLLARLDLKLGDRVTIGNSTFQLRSVVSAEPDKLAGNVGLGPRFLVSEAGLRATGLLLPGSLVRWIYRVKLPDNAADDRSATASSRLPARPRRKPAGKSAAAPMPRRSLNAPSAASPNS
jgi:putative ABC transport system permease protein